MEGEVARLTFADTPWKAGLKCLGSVGFVILGYYLVTRDFPGGRLPEWYGKVAGAFCVGAFGINFLVQLSRILWPRTLLLTQTGFSIMGLGVGRDVAWNDVQSFGVIKRRGGATAVGYRLEQAAKSRRRGGWFLSGFDGEIGVTPDETPTYLCQILNEWRRRYGRS